ncbi:glutamyl-tRNA(Gln) amidotransferase subunit C, chloroplastic/mitochondrial-like isoform X2 [Papaver somniferum]|uniref:glutamyl-tRNA(Gln) amidotransferase subunit C, chloroplastic/mitochondrial-like isoform X2 n=1 Tax=Papaver somniferum TaxID=3469 RepID=UPI000E6F8919|nr:glutamyl-tRNA(Gln) amidotransferase subunit C, chloroplastic/mitochondrial-like isoform X2 [Papaver somniferum]XP_026449040.1 glutamyl-tRNA(Gln) amidotransferase subunit C, chloroplastic/mitochondrial-like isoform X2 [Papaver somniferum]
MYANAVIRCRTSLHHHYQQHKSLVWFSQKQHQLTSNTNNHRSNFSTQSSILPPPDVSHLAQTARISLTPDEVEEFAPKIRQVIDWFGQLQAVDLHSIEPALRADTEGYNLREDVPETFDNREAILSAVPSFEEPYIKVPKILNKE